MTRGKDEKASTSEKKPGEETSDTVAVSSFTRAICDASTERRRILQEERANVEAALARSREHLPH